MITAGLSHNIDALVAEVVALGLPLPAVVRHLKRELVLAAIRKHGGNVSAAAKRLRVHRNTVARIQDRERV